MSTSLHTAPADPESQARIGRVIAALRSQFGDRLSTQPAVREQHGHGEAYAPTAPAK